MALPSTPVAPDMPFHPDLPGILSRQSRMDALKNSGGNFDLVAKQQLSTGAFKVANDRQAAWTPGIQVAGNVNADIQMDRVMSGQDIASGAATAAKKSVNSPLPGVPSTNSLVGAGTYEKQNLDQLRQEQATIEQKMNRGKAGPANETADQRSRRLHPELY